MERRKVSFHEATVVRFARVGSSIELELESVFVDSPDGKDPADYKFFWSCKGVSSLQRDDEEYAGPLQEAEDGEVLTLTQEGHAMSILIEWHSFAPLRIITHAYQITAREFKGELVKQS